MTSDNESLFGSARKIRASWIESKDAIRSTARANGFVRMDTHSSAALGHALPCSQSTVCPERSLNSFHLVCRTRNLPSQRSLRLQLRDFLPLRCVSPYRSPSRLQKTPLSRGLCYLHVACGCSTLESIGVAIIAHCQGHVAVSRPNEAVVTHAPSNGRGDKRKQDRHDHHGAPRKCSRPSEFNRTRDFVENCI